MKTQFKWWFLIPFVCCIPKMGDWVYQIENVEDRFQRLLFVFINSLITIATLIIILFNIILFVLVK